MLHSIKLLMAGVAIAVSTMFAGSAFAQDGETGAPDKPAVGLGEIGVVLDYAYAQPAFREALKSGESGVLRELLVKYGLNGDVPVIEEPVNTIVPGGPYTDCRRILITYYDIGGWPNYPLMKWIWLCNNSAGGVTSFGW